MNRFVSSVLLWVLSFGAVLPIQGQAHVAAPGNRTADLERLREWVQLEQGLTPENRRRAEERIAEMLAQAEPLGAARFFLEVAAIAALADNGHSNVGMAPAYGFGLVPLRTFWFSDGLFIVRAGSEYAHLLGAEIVSICGLGVDELVARLGKYHGGTDEMFEQYFSTPLMLCPALMHAAGLSENPHALSMEFLRRDGEEERLELAADQRSGRASGGSPWRALVPGPKNDEADGAASSGGLQTFFDPGTEMALAYDEPEATFRYVYLEREDTVYIQWRSNRDGPEREISDFIAEVRERLPADHPRSIVWDNRQNPGGDLGTTGDLARELHSFLPDDGRVYALTSNATFSAGIYTSYYPKAADPDRTVVVGERVGDREVFWAETGNPFRLPDTGFHLGYSLEMHDLAEGCFDPALCHMQKYPAGWNIGVGSFDPDVEIPTTFADYAAQRDPVLEYALERALDG